MKPEDINFVELPPGEMPTSLAAGAIDAYFVGEPFCAKAEMDGIGRVLYYSKDIWPNFISCVLVVHEDLINEKPEVVKDLVRGIAESGMWAETHREEAAKLVAPYYRQNQKVLDYVLTSKPNRVSYVNLTPTDDEINRIGEMAVRMGILKKDLDVSEFLDRSFIPEQVNAASIAIGDSTLIRKKSPN
jgi:NitT/TauT family transport system substrate-binding protein